MYSFIDKATAKVEINVNGEPVNYLTDKGFAVVEREWKKGDVLTIDIPMDVRTVKCDERVIDNVGKTAVTRGPLVYCAEEVDNPSMSEGLSIDINPDWKVDEFTTGPLSGIKSITCPGIRLIPYYSWDNRGDSKKMTVWIDDKQ